MITQVVSFHCVLKNNLGHIIGTTFNQDVLVSDPNSDSQLKGLSDGLKDLKAGEKRIVSLKAQDAYGYYNPELVLKRPLEQLDLTKPLKLGDNIVYEHNGRRQPYRVINLDADSVTFDANHPLAGQDLVFEIEATEAREATLEELSTQDSPVNTLLLH